MGLGGIHPIQLLIVLALVLLVFGGRGKISAMMGDMARGVRSFRKGLNEDETLDATPDARSEDMPEQTARRDSASNADEKD